MKPAEFGGQGIQMAQSESRLSTFFKDADTEFGIFKPKFCLIAVFSHLPDAERAEKELLSAGRAAEDVISAAGEEAVKFAEYHLLKDGLGGVLMTGLSRVFGTEAAYTEMDLEAAKKGAAFVAVRCPTEESKREAWEVLRSTRPLAARYYTGAGIEHLAGEA